VRRQCFLRLMQQSFADLAIWDERRMFGGDPLVYENQKRGVIMVKYFFVAMLVATAGIAQSECPVPSDSVSDVFPPPDGSIPPLQGKIVEGRYYSPRHGFSFAADNFGQDTYVAQDGATDEWAAVGFYSQHGNFKRVEVVVVPKFKELILDEADLRRGFESFGVNILRKVDHAEGIEILHEEMLGEDTFFVAISVDRMSVLRFRDRHIPSTRGYLLFQEGNRLVVLCHQIVTLPWEQHTPKHHISKLKEGVLDFRKTFIFEPST